MADVVHGLALLKRGSSKARIGFTAGEIGLLDGTTGVIRDLWKQEDVAALGVKPVFETEVCPHAAVLLKLTCLKNHSSALSTCRRGALRQAQGAGA